MSFEIENGVLKKYHTEPGVTEVVIPEGVTEIGERAFCCRSLRNSRSRKGGTVLWSWGQPTETVI